MTYILTAQLHDESLGDTARARYETYLQSVAGVMPAGALALARSEWWFNASDHRCPHDSRLEAVTISEAAATQGHRTVTITVRLLGAFHDGHLALTYHDVAAYAVNWTPNAMNRPFGHRDWRYDEFRLSANGLVEHEIEWWGPQETARWVIEARDLEAVWLPASSVNSAV